MTISEHSDALSPAPRPRVEGEAEAWLKSLTLIAEGAGFRPDAMSYVTPSEYRDHAERLVDSLTAEVERLRGVADRAINHGQSAQQYGDYEAWRRSWQVFRDEISLTTPAPEATDAFPSSDGKRFYSGQQVMERYVEGYERPKRVGDDYTAPPAPEGTDG